MGLAKNLCSIKGLRLNYDFDAPLFFHGPPSKLIFLVVLSCEIFYEKNKFFSHILTEDLICPGSYRALNSQVGQERPRPLWSKNYNSPASAHVALNQRLE